jgi:hypothetical protein
MYPLAPKKQRVDADAGAGAGAGADGTPRRLSFDSDDVPSIGEDGQPVPIGGYPMLSMDMHSSQQTSAPEQKGPIVSFASALKALNVPVHL